ncbi:antA/AntB antirepressor family protein [uncultured Mucilaginibacter sp.]|uniref:antA/AntB antirepressor family protein n=1 Tax=uncultured Mucilaginibacter sp. TaxID=797541 RepID=UPI0025DA4A96|nr:antA/AntB antirepressor family protein [uncultured Mucilaginibacter sp.]
MSNLEELVYHSSLPKPEGDLIVYARVLHKHLGCKTKFTLWWNEVLEFGFDRGIDFAEYEVEKGSGCQTDYALTLDCAASIALFEKSTKGNYLRQCLMQRIKQVKEESMNSFTAEYNLSDDADAALERQYEQECLRSMMHIVK